MKVSHSSRRIIRRLVKSIGIMLIIALFALAYAAMPLTAFAGNFTQRR